MARLIVSGFIFLLRSCLPSRRRILATQERGVLPAAWNRREVQRLKFVAGDPPSAYSRWNCKAIIFDFF